MKSSANGREMPPSRAGEQGQVLVIVAFALSALLALLGLVVDAGRLYVEKRQAQTAADAAAMAAALDLGLGSAEATISGLAYASLNGFDNDGTTNIVSVRIPPLSGGHTGDSTFAQVVVSKTIPTAFIQGFYGGPSQVIASATAGTVYAPASDVVMILNPTASGALNIYGTGELIIGGAGAMVNSNNATAVTVGGNVQVSLSKLDVTGGYGISGNAVVSPLPTTGVTPKPDPLRFVMPPSFSGQPVRNGSAEMPVLLDVNGSQILTLDPGIYYGGIQVRNQARVTLNPGTYILAGGGFAVRQQAVVEGSGIFFYNTNDPTHPSDAGAYGSFALDGGASVTLSPGQTGPYAKLLLFQDRNNTNQFSITSGSQMNSVGGTLYLPKANANLSGSGSTTLQLVVDTLTIGGTGAINISYSGNQFYQGRVVTLVE